MTSSEEVVLKDNFVLFWGGYPSNWYPSTFTVDGVRYNCMEQYMMAEKARLFGARLTLKQIMRTASPKVQKQLGRSIPNYDDSRWAKVRFDVVLKGTLEKYKQNPELLESLLATGTATFVECSPYDTIWGIGLSMQDKDATNPGKWRGENLLGQAITKARDTLLLEREHQASGV